VAYGLGACRWRNLIGEANTCGKERGYDPRDDNRDLVLACKLISTSSKEVG
jgi:hypothetical protein